MTGVENPHLSVPPVLAGVPLSAAHRVAVLVHGRNQDEQVMLDVVQRLALTGVAYVLPIAAQRSWYEGRYFDPAAQVEPQLGLSLRAVEAQITTTMRDAKPDARLVVGGFSQGACLVAELVARHPPAGLAGVAILTGSLIGAPGAQRTAAPVEGLPIYCSCPAHDEWVALTDAQATAETFRHAGAQVDVEVLDDREHLISDRAVAGLRSMLQLA